MTRKGIDMGKQRETLHDLFNNGEIGDWYIDEAMGRTQIFICYPVPSIYPDTPANKDFVRIPVTGTQEPKWDWDGNRDKPTLTPSINVIGRWHGWLRGGELITA